MVNTLSLNLEALVVTSCNIQVGICSKMSLPTKFSMWKICTPAQLKLWYCRKFRGQIVAPMPVKVSATISFNEECIKFYRFPNKFVLCYCQYIKNPPWLLVPDYSKIDEDLAERMSSMKKPGEDDMAYFERRYQERVRQWKWFILSNIHMWSILHIKGWYSLSNSHMIYT